jgi:hypothetical protein
VIKVNIRLLSVSNILHHLSLCNGDDLLLSNSRFGDYLHFIYPNQLEVKNITDTQKSYVYLDHDNRRKLKTQLYDKRDDFIFSIFDLKKPLKEILNRTARSSEA